MNTMKKMRYETGTLEILVVLKEALLLFLQFFLTYLEIVQALANCFPFLSLLKKESIDALIFVKYMDLAIYFKTATTTIQRKCCF